MENQKLELSEADERVTIENFIKACENMRTAFIEAGRMMTLTPDEGMMMPTVTLLFHTVPQLGELINRWDGLAQSLKLILPKLSGYRKLKTAQERVDFLNNIAIGEITDGLAKIKLPDKS